jgi:hypothetical protein
VFVETVTPSRIFEPVGLEVTPGRNNPAPDNANRK